MSDKKCKQCQHYEPSPDNAPFKWHREKGYDQAKCAISKLTLSNGDVVKDFCVLERINKKGCGVRANNWEAK